MSSIKERIDSARAKLIEIRGKKNLYVKQHEDVVQARKDLIARIEEIGQSVVIQDQAIILFKEVVDAFSREQIIRIQELVTFALQTIFFDRYYSLEVEFGDYRGTNKTLEFYLIETVELPDGGTKTIRSEFKDGIGGGVLSVVGFVLQVYFILYFKLAEVLFCDEAFSQLSDTYIEGLFTFIEKIAERNAFHFVLITHDPRFIGRSIKTYRVVRGEVMEIDKTKALED